MTSPQSVRKADLSSVLVRIDRAKRHLKDFDDQARPLAATCRDGLTREIDQQSSEYIFRLSKVPAVPPVLSAILGDAIHNLRVSLDYLAWQLVIATVEKPPNENTSFPILTTPPTADRWGRTRPNISPGVSKEVRALLDEIQPYKRDKPASHDLAVLHALDINDKHHELLVTIIGVKDSMVGWWGDYDLSSFHYGPYHDGSEVCRFTHPAADHERLVNAYMDFTVCLRESAAGPWGKMLGASELVRHPLVYIEDEVLPRFQQFFGS